MCIFTFRLLSNTIRHYYYYKKLSYFFANMKHKTYDTPECIHNDKSLHKIIMHDEKRYLYVDMMEKRDMRTSSGHYLKGVFLEQVLVIL